MKYDCIFCCSLLKKLVAVCSSIALCLVVAFNVAWPDKAYASGVIIPFQTGKFVENFANGANVSDIDHLTANSGVIFTPEPYDLARGAANYVCYTEYYSSGGACPNAFDGNPNTYWLSYYTQSPVPFDTPLGGGAHYIYFRPSSTTALFDNIRLDWGAYGIDYSIYYIPSSCQSDCNYVKLFSVAGNDQRSNTITFPPVSASKIMLMIYRVVGNGRISLYSFNVYEAVTSGYLISNVIDSGRTSHWQTLNYAGDVTSGTSLDFFTRSGDVATVDDTWSDWYEVTQSTITSPNRRYLQYKAVLNRDGPNRYVRLISVSIEYSPFPVWLNSAAATDGGGFLNQIITYAGSGQAALLDGNGLAAGFNLPSRIAIDQLKKFYVSDEANGLVRVISQNGVVSTLKDANGANLSFGHPRGIAVDFNNNIYIADTVNNQIFKRDPKGTLTVFAGSGIAGSTDGVKDEAQFDNPSDMAFDKNGDLIVADYNSNLIRKIDKNGVVSTIAGSSYGNKDGVGKNAAFRHPAGVAIDQQGNIIVADQDNHIIRKISDDNSVSTIAGTGAPGYKDDIFNKAQFNHPSGIAIDDIGNIYLSDTMNNRIRMIKTTGEVATVAGNGNNTFTNGNGQVASFSGPSDVYIDQNNGVYVVDQYNNRIRLIKLDYPKLTFEQTMLTHITAFWDSARNIFNYVLNFVVSFLE